MAVLKKDKYGLDAEDYFYMSHSPTKPKKRHINAKEYANILRVKEITKLLDTKESR